MSTLGEIVGVLNQIDTDGAARSEVTTSSSGRENRVVTDGGTFAHRRKVRHLDHLLSVAERDGTLETMFSPGYPPVRIDVAADDERGVVLVEDADATVSVTGREATISTQGRERRVTLPFAPSSTDRKSVGGLTAAVFA